MRAAWIKEFGGPEVIRVGEHADPAIEQGRVRVRMQVSSLNHRDVYLRRGEAGRVSLPVILGSDGVGIVESASPDSAFAIGDAVVIYPVVSCDECRACRSGAAHKCGRFRMIGGELDGTHADLVSVPERCLVPLPRNLDPAAAAALSLSGLTAWNMVVDEGKAQAGEHALVLGASGGVGVFVVRLLKRLGLTVHAVTSSPAKRTRLYELGADTVLDDDALQVLRKTRDLPDSGVDIAFNCIGDKTWRYSLPAVRSGGRTLICGTLRSPIAELDMRQVFYRSLSLIGCSMGRRDSLATLLDVASSDPTLRAPVAMSISLDGLGEAHRQMEAGTLTGKVLLQLNPRVSP